MSLRDHPGYFGITSQGVIAIHANWPMYPEEHGADLALLWLTAFPRRTAFQRIDDIDRCNLLLADVKCWRYADKRSKVKARLHDLRHTFGSTLRRTMSKEDVASTMGISGAIAGTYLDHESADLTRRAFAKPGTNAAQSPGAAVSDSK